MPVYGYEGKTYTLSELRFLFPHVSFPANPTGEALPPGVTFVPDAEPTPEDMLAHVRADKLVRLGEAFEHVQRFGHFGSSLGFEVDANERANRDVGGLVTMLEPTGEKETLFCDYGNSMRRVTLEQLKRLQLELIAYGRMLYARKWELREAVNAARTPGGRGGHRNQLRRSASASRNGRRVIKDLQLYLERANTQHVK